MAKDKDFREGLRSAYIPHDPVDQDPGGVSCTRQEFADECDINQIMARYEKVGGMLPPAMNVEPRYLDLTQMPADFMSAMGLMMQAEESFMQLPANVRRTFENDPAEFVKYAMDPNNLGQMRDWGLAPPAPRAEAPMRVEVVNPKDPPEQPAKPAPSGGSAKPTQ